MRLETVPLKRKFPEGPDVRGFLHRTEVPGGNVLVITHGAGSNCETPLLVKLAEEFATAGITVLRCDLPYRQRCSKGPPSPSNAVESREGLRNAITVAREFTSHRVYLGGQSYGGRQATILASETPELAAALLLISYPLHLPRAPERIRTGHFPLLKTPSLFAHGSLDPFGSLNEMSNALSLIPARHQLIQFKNSGHGLVEKNSKPLALQEVAIKTVAAFQNFVAP